MKNKMNVVFYIPALYKGGSERVLINLAVFFQEKGYRVAIVTDYRVQNEYEVPDGIERVVLVDTHSEKLTAFKAIWRFRRFCRDHAIGTVIAFLNIYHAVLGTLFSQTRCILSIRNDPQESYKTTLSKIKNRVLLPLADGVVFQTREARESFPYLRDRKTDIIENPIQDVFFDYDHNGSPNKLVTFGRLTAQKNQALLIDAVSDVVKRYPDVTLEIYGDGELKPALLQRIRELALEDHVFLRDSTTDVPSIMARSGIFILPSLFEGMPNALMEAMAVGMPCIATDCPCGGSAVLLRDDGGLLVKNNDRDDLTNAIIALLEKEDLRRHYSQNAKEKARLYKSKTIFLKWKTFLENK